MTKGEKSEELNRMMFDLKKLQALVGRVKPPGVIILDTNIMLDAAPIIEWKIPVVDMVFVVTDVLVDELVNMSESKNTRKAYLARQAKKSIDGLLDKWNNGENDIYYRGIGYFIKITSPDRKILEAEFGKFPQPTINVGDSDMTLLFLTKECNEKIKHLSTMLGTADKDLYREGVIRGVPFYLFDKAKPWESLSQQVKIIKPGIDWSAEIDAIGKSKVHVELTLSGVRLISTSVPDAQKLKLASGQGLLSYWGEDYSFTWSLQYQPYNVFSVLHPLDSAPTIEFDARQNLPEAVINRLHLQLMRYANVEPWELETLQEPDSIMLQLMYFDYLRTKVLRKGKSYLGEIYEFETSLDTGVKKTFRRAFAHYALEGRSNIGKMEIADFAKDWIFDVQNWSTDAEITYLELFSSLFNRWEVGNSVEFDFCLSDDVVV